MGPTAVLMFLTVLFLSQQLSPCESLRIAAFNLEMLAKDNIYETDYGEQLVNFICEQEWDIAFLQELTSVDALKELVLQLNRNDKCRMYTYVTTGELPSIATTNREIYAYIYRPARVTIDEHKLMQVTREVDGDMAEVFFRPPFVVRVDRALPKCMKKIVLIGIHTRPARTYSELNGLVDVYEMAKMEYGTDNALILGDLNADRPSFGAVDKMQNILVLRSDFNWVIKDGDMTNHKQSRSYDRIIAVGDMMIKTAHNRQIPKWNEEAEHKAGKRLSNHYPVSVDLDCVTEEK